MKMKEAIAMGGLCFLQGGKLNATAAHLTLFLAAREARQSSASRLRVHMFPALAPLQLRSVICRRRELCKRMLQAPQSRRERKLTVNIPKSPVL